MSKTAFVFPGQGSQYVGMGSSFIVENKIVEETFAEADQALGFSISKICLEGPEEALRSTSFTQPAILTFSIALERVMKDNGIYPDIVAGHSLGEYSALVSAKVLDFKDAVKLVHIRGKLMEEAFAPGKGTMAAIMGLSAEQVDIVCKDAENIGVVQAANYNCPGQVVIAGTKEAVEKASEIAKKNGAKRIFPLNVSGPFHSSLMEQAAERFTSHLNEVVFKQPHIPVVANYSAKALQSVEEIKSALFLQIANPVLWEQSVRTMLTMGVTTFVEIGPGKVLTGLIKKVSTDVKLLSTDDGETLANSVALLKECS